MKRIRWNGTAFLLVIVALTAGRLAQIFYREGNVAGALAAGVIALGGAVAIVRWFVRGGGPSGKAMREMGEREHPARTDADALALAGVADRSVGGVTVWEFYQPSARKAAVLMALFGGVMVVVCFVLPFIMLVIVGSVGVLLLGLAHGMWWHRSSLRIDGHDLEVVRRGMLGRQTLRLRADEVGDVTLERAMEFGGTRYFRMNLVGVPGVDADGPHPHEHFRARKARYQWQRAQKDGAGSLTELQQRLIETPRFEVRVADYLGTAPAAEQSRMRLLALLVGE